MNGISHINSKDKPYKTKRSAQNYTIVVLTLLFGAFLLAFINIFIGKYSIFLAMFTFLFSFSIEILHAKNIR